VGAGALLAPHCIMYRSMAIAYAKSMPFSSSPFEKNYNIVFNKLLN